MGEAKRRKSDTSKMAIEVEIFDPSYTAIVLNDAVESQDPLLINDKRLKLHATALLEMNKRLNQRPTPICGACDYEFELGEIPTLMYVNQPFIPEKDSAAAYRFYCGPICSRCADLPFEDLKQAMIKYLRQANPSLETVEIGRA